MGVHTYYYMLMYEFTFVYLIKSYSNPEFVHSEEDFRKGCDLAFLNSLDLKGKSEGN